MCCLMKFLSGVLRFTPTTETWNIWLQFYRIYNTITTVYIKICYSYNWLLFYELFSLRLNSTTEDIKQQQQQKKKNNNKKKQQKKKKKIKNKKTTKKNKKKKKNFLVKYSDWQKSRIKIC